MKALINPIKNKIPPIQFEEVRVKLAITYPVKLPEIKIRENKNAATGIIAT